MIHPSDRLTTKNLAEVAVLILVDDHSLRELAPLVVVCIILHVWHRHRRQLILSGPIQQFVVHHVRDVVSGVRFDVEDAELIWVLVDF